MGKKIRKGRIEKLGKKREKRKTGAKGNIGKFTQHNRWV